MASSFTNTLSIFLLSLFAVFSITKAGDPNILTDFIAPNLTVDGNFFTFRGFRTLLDQTPPNFKVTKASLAEHPALNGQSVSYAVLQFPAGSVNPPHTHPRSAELLFVFQGSLQVGFVDTTNKLYNQTLGFGDIFIFPKGLVHFQFNAAEKEPATAISAFGSANAGTVSVPFNVFGTGIDDVILAKSFKTDVGIVQKIKAGLVPAKP